VATWGLSRFLGYRVGDEGRGDGSAHRPFWVGAVIGRQLGAQAAGVAVGQLLGESGLDDDEQTTYDQQEQDEDGQQADEISTVFHEATFLCAR
jgi:hypothetical protein